ncbi:TPA: hypothetical protein U1B28_000153 [Streptococcus suis]|uniref:hypothetical protein n=1 Tax=Streptococcus suis TaxID=1307 RepID=UPI00209AEC6D|nr:hypothetical protein [Streptococcus suis]MCO8175202.1 hypothetical protein [Streptococcus suis]MCO8208999.1 hypothetical protein [Streptococcus suis]HEM3488580.1 hypothetical protein [Streptococcus suis]HEM3507281.1 hypothetical protein [Streptococcus suis]
MDGKESKTEFSYDAENRLLEMKSGDKTITYIYDKNGNRTSSGTDDAKLDYIYDTENRLLAVKDKEGLLFAALYDGDDNRVFTASRPKRPTPTSSSNASQRIRSASLRILRQMAKPTASSGMASRRMSSSSSRASRLARAMTGSRPSIPSQLPTIRR